MKYIPYITVILALVALFYAYGTQQQTMRLGATILTTASSNTLETFRTNVNTSLDNLNNALTSMISTSTAETRGQLAYWTSTSATPPTLGSVATTTVSCAQGTTCSSFTTIGSTAVSIQASSTVSSGNGVGWNLINQTSTTTALTLTIPANTIRTGTALTVSIPSTLIISGASGYVSIEAGYGFSASTTLFMVNPNASADVNGNGMLTYQIVGTGTNTQRSSLLFTGLGLASNNTVPIRSFATTTSAGTAAYQPAFFMGYATSSPAVDSTTQKNILFVVKMSSAANNTWAAPLYTANLSQ